MTKTFSILQFKHLIIKVKSDKVFEATIATEFTLKLLENNKDNCSLFRALVGTFIICRYIMQHVHIKFIIKYM